MSKTTKITLEIQTDKLPDFYLALIRHKVSPNDSIDTLKIIADAIHFDYKGLTKTIKLDETKQRLLKDKLLSVHAYLYNSKKDSPGYLEVSKNTLEAFEASAFGKELKNSFYLMELSRQWTGKADSTEVQAFIAMYVFSMSLYAETVKTTLYKAKKTNTLILIDKQGTGEQEINIVKDEKGRFIIKTEDGQDIEAELFAEKKGQIIKLTESEIAKANNTARIFLKVGDEITLVEKKGDKTEVTPYNNVKIRGNRLDLSSATAGKISTEPTQPIVIKGDAKEVDARNVKADAAMFQQLEQEFRRFLRLPKGAREYTEVRDEIIIGLYHNLAEHYPNLTIHVYTTIAGYIASRMGLLHTQEIYDETERKQPYRKYLRDTVYNILKSHHLVKK